MNRLSTVSPTGLLFSVTTARDDTPAPWFGIEHAHAEWNRLIAAALFENSITLLGEKLGELPTETVPAEIRQRIASLNRIWVFKLRHLEQRLTEAVELLSAAGFEVMLLKGAALAMSVYPRFSARPMADLDLMVAPEQAGDAHVLLQRAGWSVANEPLPLERWNSHHHLPPLADTTGSGLRLELHTAALPAENPFSLSLGDLRNHARPIKIGNAVALIPDGHVHAVHAAIHFAFSHQFTSGALNFFRDIERLSSGSDWSWDDFTRIALSSDAAACCYWALRLSQSLGHVEVPGFVLQRLSPPFSPRFAAILDKHLQQVVLRSENACPSVELRRRMWAFALGLPAEAFNQSGDWQLAPASIASKRKWRRVGNHLLRAPAWSRYVASLVPLLIAT